MKRLINEEYKSFSSRLQGKVCSRPLTAHIELTFCCNFNCLYCYLGSLRNGSDINHEMTFTTAKHIIDQLYDAEFLWLVMSGGEPLSCKDFSRIYCYAKEKGFIVIILTNAALIGEKMIELFARYQPFYLDITLNALDEPVYERISGVKGSFKKAMEGIAWLTRYHIPFALKTKAITENVNQLGRIEDFARALGVPYSTSYLVHSCLDGDKGPLRFRLAPAQVDALRGEDKEEDSLSHQCHTVPANRLFRCGALRFSVCIEPAGKLIACQCLRQPSFDLMQGSLQKGIEFLMKNVVQKDFTRDIACRSCRLADFCDRCPGLAQLETGNCELPVEYFCEVARQRYEQNKRTLTAHC